jgi:glucose/arabinose dehydrogenase
MAETGAIRPAPAEARIPGAGRRPKASAGVGRRAATCIAIVAVALLLSGCAVRLSAAELPTERIKLPPGFRIEAIGRVPGARSLAPAPDLGAIFVGSRGSQLHALVDRDGDGRFETVETLARDLKVANGLAYHDGHLYIAEQHRVSRYRPARGALAPSRLEILYDRLPDKSHHGWRYAAVGPDRRLYVAVGAPCNVCEVSGLEGTIVRMGLDGSAFEVFARGVRNSVGIDFHPRTGEAYFTDNGADWMGDDAPPDELNHAPRAGLDFGYPYYGGGRAGTRDFRNRPPPRDAVFPIVEFGAHVAALGIHFYRGRMFPEAYRTDAFVAQHGSWNKSVPDGYRVMRVRFDAAGRALGTEGFADGWLSDGSAWGRPVDVKELPDGSLIVSDDRAGAIYRISYVGP